MNAALLLRKYMALILAAESYTYLDSWAPGVPEGLELTNEERAQLRALAEELRQL